MTDWQADKRWSDQFLPEIKGILGEHLIGEASREEDAQHNTDLIVLRMEAVRIGCRVRRREYAQKYAAEFTIRSGRPSGAKTELTKIVEGWGDYFFYGFGDDTTVRLNLWHLADLCVFRLWFNRRLIADKGACPGVAQSNRDNSSSFHVFRWDSLPSEFVIGIGGYAEE